MNNKPGFLYLALSTVFLAVQFLLFIKGSSVLLSMDFTGWLFFITSCVSHAACLTLIPFLLFYLPLSALHHWKIGGALMVTVLSMVSVLIFLDMQVYDIDLPEAERVRALERTTHRYLPVIRRSLLSAPLKARERDLSAKLNGARTLRQNSRSRAQAGASSTA